ncbi:MAG: hypothetical protein IID50_10835 [Proteobacteria bacterium]|nr:hypothetical protein [Pseudomonadota bacterium]
MRRIVKTFRRPPTGRIRDRNGGLPRLSDGVAHASRCPASPQRTLLAENLGKPARRVMISVPWYDSSQPPKTVVRSSIDRKRGHSSGFGDLGWATRRIRAHVKVYWGARKRSFGKRRAPGPRRFNPAADDTRRHVGADFGRRASINHSISVNSRRGIATSASWNVTCRPWLTTLAPIFTSFSGSVVSGHG